jgi:hypothetical protein
MQPRIILARINNIPAIIIPTDIINSGRKAGSIDDIVLFLKYTEQGNTSVNQYTFFPKFMKDNYSLFETYNDRDFQKFQTISLGERSRMEKYIIFTASNETFEPYIGDVTTEVFMRIAGSSKFTSQNSQDFTIDKQALHSWLNDSAIITANINSVYRQQLMAKRYPR